MSKDEEFFIGFMKKPPPRLAIFMMVTALGLLLGMAVVAFASRATMDDGGGGRFQGNTRQAPLVGVLELHPYPVLRLPADDDNGPRTMMLSGQGKRGVIEQGSGLAGQLVDVRGAFIRRGDLTMIQVAGRGRNMGLGEADEDTTGGFTPTAPKDLGRWKITGEICDGKCYTGAMRPGRGLAHKACANFCVFGGVPPVFVSSAPVDGGSFFLLADENGAPLGEEISRWMALFIEAEGRVERLDNLLVFKMNTSSVRVLR